MNNFDKFPVLCDLDGVVWLAHQPIAGSVEAVSRLRQAGHRVVFVTNNSSATRREQEDALAAVGISATGDVITSAMAGASLVQSGESVLVCGGPGIEEELRDRGARVVTYAEAKTGGSALLMSIDTVMVGFHRWFDYDVMRCAAEATRHGARLVGTNDDATYPTPNGPIPGGGSILSAIATASGLDPVIAGKPHRAMADLVRNLVFGVDERTVMVGDRPSTDGRFATTVGCRYALVRSGVTTRDMNPDSHPRAFDQVRVDLDVASLAAVAELLLS